MKKESHPYQTTRIWVKTLDRLRILAAHRRQSMVEVLDELVREAMGKEVKE